MSEGRREFNMAQTHSCITFQYRGSLLPVIEWNLALAFSAVPQSAVRVQAEDLKIFCQALALLHT